jgi:hypothetical protein
MIDSVLVDLAIAFLLISFDILNTYILCVLPLIQYFFTFSISKYSEQVKLVQCTWLDHSEQFTWYFNPIFCLFFQWWSVRTKVRSTITFASEGNWPLAAGCRLPNIKLF